MNFNALIAVLVIKQIITQEEGQSLVEHLHDKPQSTELRDAIAAVGEIIGAPALVSAHAPLTGGPAQQQEELAARAAQPTSPVAPPPAPLEPANTQGPDNVTGPDQSSNPASLESDETEHAEKSTMSADQSERQEENAKTLDKPADSASTASNADKADDSSAKADDGKNTSNKKSSKK